MAPEPGKRQRRNQKHGNGAAQRRSARGAENERVSQRVAEQALEKHSGCRQSRAHQSGGKHPRKPESEQDDACVSGLCRVQQGAQHFAE